MNYGDAKDPAEAYAHGIDLKKLGDEAKPYTPKANGNAGQDDYELVRLSGVDPTPINWLWESYLAIGKLTLLGGDPDLGKTLISNDTAARLSTQRHWPNGAMPIRLQGTIFLCSEDAIADTVRPRCEAAGADLNHLHVFKMRTKVGKRKTFNLHDDLDTLGAAIEGAGDIGLIVVDAITSYMGKIDSHRTTDVRGVLEPLAEFAEAHRVAIFGITHPPKAAQGNALRAFTGSFAFVAAPRMAFFVTSEPDTDRRLLLPVKNNIGPKARGIGYRIITEIITNGIIAPRIMWSDEPVDLTADQAIAAANAAAKNPGARREAMEFLKELLANGPVDAKEGLEAAKENGIAEATLRRARSDLGVKAVHKPGLHDGWDWVLP